MNSRLARFCCLCLAFALASTHASGNTGESDKTTTTVVRHIVFDPSNYSLTVGQTAPVSVVPGQVVVVTIEVVGGQPHDTPIWIDSWAQKFQWKETHRDGKDTVVTTVTREMFEDRKAALTKNGNVSLQANIDSVQPQSVPIEGRQTKINVTQPGNLTLSGVVAQRPAGDLSAPPNPGATPAEKPRKIETAPKSNWYKVTIEIIG